MAAEPSRKRQKLDTVPRKSKSSFNLTPAVPSVTHENILDINQYIPAGCLRIRRSDCSGISSEVWKSCNHWSTFAHPRNAYPLHDGEFLLNVLQESLLNSKVLHSSRVLHNAGWIRMEFQAKDEQSGQVRVYILPDDVGRRIIDRHQTTPRKAMQLLLAQLDISRSTWEGDWLEDTPVAHVDASLDCTDDEPPSLFYLFNTLPSPKPDPEMVTDLYARDAMYSLLDSDIEGLNTTMHAYQRRTAAMMLQREMQPSQLLDPRLRVIKDQRGVTWYCDLDASSCLREPRTYESAKGGICAETMGLGKTLICLALILATKELSSQIPVEYSCGTIPVRKTVGSLKTMAAAAIGRTGTPWKKYFAEMEAEGYDYSQCVEAIRDGAGHYYLPGPAPRRESRNPVVIPPRKIWLTSATIVVVPANLVRQWELEIKKHTMGLKVLVVKNSRAKEPLLPAKELAEFDIILFSKQRFDQEAADGSDTLGRRKSTTSTTCRCPYIGSTRERDCKCFREEDAYRSPLKDLHIKRLITDEGHTFGNASKSSRTEGVTVVEFLQLSARWIVSGTPTQGLYGADISMQHTDESSGTGTPTSTDSNDGESNFTGTFNKSLASLPAITTTLSPSKAQEAAFYKQERKDLEKLGNIATVYLKTRPWANTQQDGDVALWSQHVLQPRHGSKSHGNIDCLRATLEGMIIRHRPEDVEKDIVLPPLYQTSVFLDGSMQDKLSLNMFTIMMVSNAVTSERKDADYFFHPRQRKALNQLVSNLRQASFHWSGFTMDDIEKTIAVGKTFLEKGEVHVSLDDELLLRDAIRYGEMVLANPIKRAISQWHEMPMYVESDCPTDVRVAWALDWESTNPTLMGASMVHSAQKFVGSQLWKENPMEGLDVAGRNFLKASLLAANPPPVEKKANKHAKDSRSNKPNKKADQAAPELAGGVTVETTSPKKRVRAPSSGSTSRAKRKRLDESELLHDDTPLMLQDERPQVESKEEIRSIARPKSAMKQSNKIDVSGSLDPSSPLASASIVSTSSAKLSYLMDRIVVHHKTEKILVFYESDNVAYYIAQALECLHIKHLIYAKSLPSARKAQYVVTFNQTDTFRVLLMDISQAAFGLDMSSASRVYFINPVFSPQVEVQAVKRAHRIGQTKPVFVETLVLKGSIEEAILDRRSDMTSEEHNKCKNILDDQTMYDWIRNVRFLAVSIDGVPGPEQMARLAVPQLVFGRAAAFTPKAKHDPDADLVLDDVSPKVKKSAKAKVTFQDSDDEEITTTPASHRRKKLRFQAPVNEGWGGSHIQVVQYEEDGDDDDDGSEIISSFPKPTTSRLGQMQQMHATQSESSSSSMSQPQRYHSPRASTNELLRTVTNAKINSRSSAVVNGPHFSTTQEGQSAASNAVDDGMDDLGRYENATATKAASPAPASLQSEDDEIEYITPRKRARGPRTTGR